MKDERNIRQIIIDRITAYNNSFEFYDIEAKQEYDFASMSDGELVRTFEMLVFNYHKVKKQYRNNNPDIQAQRR